MSEERIPDAEEGQLPGHDEVIAELVARTRQDSDSYRLLEMFADMQLVPLRYAARHLGREGSTDLSLHVLGPLTKTFNAIQSERAVRTGWLYIWLPEHLAWAVAYVTRKALRKAMGLSAGD